MKGKIKILSLLGIALFLIILSRINLGALVDIFAQTNVLLLFMALLVNCAAIVLKSLKWKTMPLSLRPEA